MKKNRYSYILLMVILSAIYVLIQEKSNSGDSLADTAMVILSIIAAVCFLVELRSNERLNEASFIMELNNQFISNEDFTDVEYILESYYITYKSTKPENRKELTFGDEIKFDTDDRQKIVNYLVYLEGIASLVNSGVLHLNIITDLMAYRYFIAVNNPIIQENELLKYPEYYKGCIGIYEKWAKELKKKKVNIPIPMEEEALPLKIKNMQKR